MDEMKSLLKQTLAEFDKDLATMIVMASLGQDTNRLRQMLATASHMQNLRSLAQDMFTDEQKKIIEATNNLLQQQLSSTDEYIN